MIHFHLRRVHSLTILLIGMGLASACSGSRTLQEDDEDEDQVDIGYGKMDPDNFTGSITTVSRKDLKNQTFRTVADMLRGRVAGVEVTEGAGGYLRIRIRGARSFTGSTAPLFVVDGVPLFHTTDEHLPVNPYDVETITILKDAGSSAIYGSRAGNGVVLVTTRRRL